MRELLGILQGNSAIDGAYKLGVTAALGYHFTCQFPAHRDVLTCLCVSVAFNIFHLATIVKFSLCEILLASFAFNAIFVRPLWNLC